MISQHTLSQAATLNGIGVHSGRAIQVKLCPAGINNGISFRRIDASGQALSPDLLLKPENIVDTRLASTLGVGEWRISTIEHLVAALSGLGVDNLLVEVSEAEMPILDGSAVDYVRAIQTIGVTPQEAAKTFLKITRPLEVLGENGAYARLEPSESFELEVTLSYDNHPVMREMPLTARFSFGADDFTEDLSRARTFGFMSDYEKLRAMNLAQGASLDNTVVIDQTKVLNPEGLRYDNECARHKMLDALGDLYQLGYTIIGHFSSCRPGHTLNNLLTRHLQAHPECWTLVTYESLAVCPPALSRWYQQIDARLGKN